MLSPCYSTTAAAPLLGPSLRRIRETPLARLLIGYRANSVVNYSRYFTYLNHNFAHRLRQHLDNRCEPIEELQKHDRQRELAHSQDCVRNLGNALLLDRLLTGGNQNEFLPVLPIMNRRLIELQQNGSNGIFFDAIA